MIRPVPPSCGFYGFKNETSPVAGRVTNNTISLRLSLSHSLTFSVAQSLAPKLSLAAVCSSLLVQPHFCCIVRFTDAVVARVGLGPFGGVGTCNLLVNCTFGALVWLDFPQPD